MKIQNHINPQPHVIHQKNQSKLNYCTQDAEAGETLS